MEERAVYLITGPMAAGKSTVARLLASRFALGVCLEGDLFRRSIVRGREDMTPDASPQALRQLRLRHGLAAAAADEYFDAGFTVVVEDVVAGPILNDYAKMIRSRPWTPRIGFWLDTTDLTPDETVEAILAQTTA